MSIWLLEPDKLMDHIKFNGVFRDMMNEVHVDEKWFRVKDVQETVYLLPGEKPPPLKSSVKAIPKPLKIVPKSLVSPSPRQTTTTASKPLKKTNLSTSLNINTSVIKKSSGLRVELKEFINEETNKSELKPSTAQLEQKNSTTGKHV